MRQVRVQGCLPTLAVLLVVAALGAVAFTAGLAVVLVTGASLLVLAAWRALRRLTGPRAPPGPSGGEQVQVESVAPGWLEREGGPVVEAGPRAPPIEGPDADGGGAHGAPGEAGRRPGPPGSGERAPRGRG
jgi:hypothetical protein